MMTRTALATAIATTAVASLAVVAWTASAAPGDGDTTFTPITPCRLFDDRPAPNTIGPNNTPLTAGNDRTVQITGTTGDCTIPEDATAIAMNVTIANPTNQSNLRAWPADQPKPTASNLNWLPGQSPTPNKVDVALSPTGAINLANHQGQVNVIADAVGYYSPTSLTELAERVAALENAPSPTPATQNSPSWLGVNADGTVSTASPDLADAVVRRPSPASVGSYCIEVSDDAAAAALTNEAAFVSLQPFTTAPVYANVGGPNVPHSCGSGGESYFVAVDTRATNGAPFDHPFTVGLLPLPNTDD